MTHYHPATEAEDETILQTGQKAINSVRIALRSGNSVRLELRNGSTLDVDSPIIVSREGIEFPSDDDKMMTVHFDEIIAVRARCNNWVSLS